MRNAVNFNHISKDITDDERKKLTDLYKFYHKLSTCYRWEYKKLRRTYLSLNMLGIGLTSVGAVVGGLTLNPIMIGLLAGPGILLEAYITKSNTSRRIGECRFAYTNYKKILIQIRNFLRGAPMDDKVFLSDIKVIDDIVTDTCPCVEKHNKRYLKKYNVE